MKLSYRTLLVATLALSHATASLTVVYENFDYKK
jgi:hypothetical protein